MGKQRKWEWNLSQIITFSENSNGLIILQKKNVQPSEVKCCHCNSDMKIVGERWRCWKTVSGKKGKKKCNGEMSIRRKSWFSKSKLTLGKIMELTYMLLRNYQQIDTERECELNKNTVTDWMSFVRQVLEDYSFKRSEPIGGEGKIVEIDESKFGRRKYNRSHTVEGQWVFGGIERDSGKVFLVPVELRNRKTLTEIIKKWIKEGTTIISDCWTAYDNLGEEGYQHLTVNHSINFVDPTSGAHTNSVESTWRHAKRFMPHYNRRKRNYPESLAHYMFIKSCKMENKDEVEEFWKLVGEIDFEPAAPTFLEDKSHNDSDSSDSSENEVED